MSHRLSQSLERGQRPEQPRNARLGNLQRRIRAVQKSRQTCRRIRPPVSSTPSGYNQSQAIISHATKKTSTGSVAREDDVVLNFQNMDQDCALRPATANATTNTLGASDTFQCASINRATFHRPQTPVTSSTSHTRLTTDERGQLRYFGYSSLIRMVSILPPSSPPGSAVAGLESETLTRIGEDATTLADSAETHYHLIELFFRYQHAALPILDEIAFREAYARGKRTEYYSTFLLHSILLRALKFSALPQAGQLKKIYLRRIRDQLLFEIENPSIATIPALCMFGSYLAGEGSDRGCWLYPGLAFRLLYDFGLHEDCSNLVESGRLTEEDRRMRLSILYHCYVFDKLYSSFQGRPTAVRLEDFSCRLPSQEILGSEGHVTAAFVHLSSILEEILPIINGRRREIIYQSTSMEKLSRASAKLLQWFKSLPPELRWNAEAMQSPSPATCALHVQFLSVTILLNRPFAAYMLKSFGDRVPSDGYIKERCLDGQTPEVSQKLCTSSGIRISKILLKYRIHHGADKFFSTINPACLSASIALISEIVSAGSGVDKREEKLWLSAILETLHEITPTYPVAGRSHMVLCAIVKACGLAGVVPPPVSSSSDQVGIYDPRSPPLDQHFQTAEEPQSGLDSMVWSMDDSLGWEFYPILDDVHDIGLADFYPHLSPWPPVAPDCGN